MVKDLPLFITEYKTLYKELHPEGSQPQVSVKELDKRIVSITESLHKTAPPLDAVFLNPDDVKILTFKEVADVNKLARNKLWNASPWYKKIIIRVVEFLTGGRRTGIHQIPVKEFIASVQLYVNKAKVNQLQDDLTAAIPEMKSGYIEAHAPVGNSNCFFIWRNKDAKSDFTVTVRENGQWKLHKCTINNTTINVGTPPVFSFELDPKEDKGQLIARLSEKIETMFNVQPYGKVHFEALMGPYFETESVRKAEGKVDVAVVGLAAHDKGYILSTLTPESDEIKRELVTVSLNGTVLLQELDDKDAPIEDAVRSFKSVESFIKAIDNPMSWPLKKALEMTSANPIQQKAISKAREELLEGADALKLLQTTNQVEALKSEITQQLVNGLSPSNCGAFVYVTSDQHLLKVVFPTTDGVREKDLIIKSDGSVLWQGNSFTKDQPLSVVLNLAGKPFTTMNASRKNLKERLEHQTPLKDICEKLRRTNGFYDGHLVTDEPEGFVWDTGAYAIVPNPKKGVEQDWISWLVGKRRLFTGFILWVDAGGKLKRHEVAINPARGNTPFGYEGKWYKTPEEVAMALYSDLDVHPASKPVKAIAPPAQPAPVALPLVPKAKIANLLPPAAGQPKTPAAPPAPPPAIAAAPATPPPPKLGAPKPPGPSAWSAISSYFTPAKPAPVVHDDDLPPLERIDDYDEESIEMPAPVRVAAPDSKQQIRARLDALSVAYRHEDKNAPINWSKQHTIKYGLTRTRAAIPSAMRAAFDKDIKDLGYEIRFDNTGYAVVKPRAK